ncbi:MAG TPA: DUF1844 domain-containing protein [Blastocatellia bacterium]|nr:DUF1844 domain-containing protein [Blastocatellia bacterium]
MPEREDTSFKVTDRRKYNPDGSPRDSAETGVSPVAAEAEAQTPITEPAPNNVVSFPGEAVKNQPEPAPQVQVAGETKAPGPTPTADQVAAGRAEKAYNQARGPQSSRLPEASFLGLANMLAVEAAMHLGLIQSPGEEPPPPDLEAARHLIDMLGILQTKTRGNLTGEEDNMLENMLADLRMQFVAISQRR